MGHQIWFTDCRQHMRSGGGGTTGINRVLGSEVERTFVSACPGHVLDLSSSICSKKGLLSTMSEISPFRQSGLSPRLPWEVGWVVGAKEVA